MNKNWITLSLALCSALLLSACASNPYPLNMTEEQWNKLTPDERKTLLLKQQEYQEQQRLERIKANAKRDEQQMALKLKEQERLNRLYSNPGNGNVLMVNLLSGEYRSHKKSYQLQPYTTLIARGETKEIELVMRDNKQYTRTERAWLQYNPQGTGIYLYLSYPSDYNHDRITLLRNADWICGSQHKSGFQFSKYEALNHLRIYIEEQGSQCYRRHR
ncbi:hypothetical protein QCB44_01290 [Thiomicrorhabdus sp. zzn3]|uniref:hypothetical protein n=1 Tax=Thiomicrorhabdus sp. zzn3 TaxID=3039775 RepID=UPI0024367470|nr:hypothetical protein [Thiomicrorhabdus sp. zzn3]MDG6777331.1 hypothetical protein [Thiomicrorhabdus sp. zzn3]